MTNPTDDVIERAERWLCDDLNAWQFWASRLIRDLASELRASRARVAELERDQRLLAEVVQAPFPLHDYCSEEAWTRACHIVAALSAEDVREKGE